MATVAAITGEIITPIAVKHVAAIQQQDPEDKKAKILSGIITQHHPHTPRIISTTLCLLSVNNSINYMKNSKIHASEAATEKSGGHDSHAGHDSHGDHHDDPYDSHNTVYRPHDTFWPKEEKEEIADKEGTVIRYDS